MPQILKRFLGTSTNDRMMAATAGLVQDSCTFSEARFSRREPMSFLGIALDWAIAGHIP
jgi:hypothetical protein